MPDERVVLVTGAAGGIGLATAMRFGRSGCAVVVVDVDEARLDEAARALVALGVARVLTVSCDVALRTDVVRAVDQAIAVYGRLDVIVNNAGAMRFAPIEEIDEDAVQAVLGVNLLGPLWFIQQAFLKCRRGSAVVNVSSVHAVRTSPNVASYAASKAALLALTRAAAIEGKARGIRVNAVVVGAVDTPMLHANPNVRSGAESLDAAFVGRPDEVAMAIEYLASSAAAFVDGVALDVDGGRLARL